MNQWRNKNCYRRNTVTTEIHSLKVVFAFMDQVTVCQVSFGCAEKWNKVCDQVHLFAQSLYPSFQRNPQCSGQLSILHWQHLNLYTEFQMPGLATWTWRRTVLHTKSGILHECVHLQEKEKTAAEWCWLNIMEKFPFYFDTAITGVRWHLELLPRPWPRGLQQTKLLRQECFRLNTSIGWGKEDIYSFSW